MNRDFSAEHSDQRWVADISEFACLDGKLFLAGIVDLHDRTMVGWSMGERQITDLVVNALVMALARRHPDGELIHHADRGSQGGFNWSLQHLDQEVDDGKTSRLDEGADRTLADEVAGRSIAAPRGGARVSGNTLRPGSPAKLQQPPSTCLKRAGSLVPQGWRDAANGPETRNQSLSVVR